MPLSISADLALLAVKSLLRYRGRVDTILSLNQAAAGLPFALPPAPTDNAPHIDNMVAFFKQDHGRLILHLHGLQEVFDKVAPNPRDMAVQGSRSRLMSLYYEAAEIQPEILGPNEHVNETLASTGPSTDMRLAYYVVRSHRLSKNRAMTRVLLATADTILETIGENAGLFISNPRTRSIVETLLNEFAIKHDFDDDRAEEIFKRLLGSAIIAASENRGMIPDKPALNILFTAISDVRKDLGDDFVARIISVEGFEKLASDYLIHVVKDPAFLNNDELAKKVISAMLMEVGKELPALMDDPKAFTGVLEVGLTAAAANVDKILAGKFDDKPLLATILSAVAGEIEKYGRTNNLFKGIAHGDFIPAVYKTVLSVIAANPEGFANELGSKKLIAELISGLADALSDRDVSGVFTTESLNIIASKCFEVLATNPAFLARNNVFAMNVLGAVLKSGSDMVKDGLNMDDLLLIADAAIKAASDNIALADMDETLCAILVSAGETLIDDNIKKLLSPEHRKDVLVMILKAVEANPKVWEDMKEQDIIRPLFKNILDAFSSDQTRLLSGTAMILSIQKVLLAVSRHGKKLLDRRDGVVSLKTLLVLALENAYKALGKGVDRENLPEYLSRITSIFLKSPFPLTDPNKDKITVLMEQALKNL